MTPNENIFSKFSFPALPLVAFLLLVSLAIMGGLPSPERVNGFLIGIAILLVVSLSFAFAGWHLLSRPMPSQYKALSSSLRTIDYQVMAIISFTSQIFLTIGGTWDEIWHTRYGIPFGEDFFWRPHLMLYAGFLLTIGLGAYALFRIIRMEKGTLQQRFRADSFLGLQALFGAFTVYALAADPIWHLLYGEDITAWSIPHVILILIWVMNMVMGIAMQYSAMTQRQWASILRFSFADIIPIFLAACVLLMVLVMFAVQWELYSVFPNVAAEVMRYPDWFFPLFVVFTASFVGILGNMASKRIGTASLIALAAIAIRFILVYALDHISRSANPWLLALMPMLGIDLVFALHLRLKGQSPAWYLAAIGVLFGTILGMYPLLNMIYVFPNVSTSNFLTMTVALAAGALLAAWMASRLGQMLSPKATESANSSPKVLWLAPLAFLLLIGMIALFVITASPPA